MVFVPRPGGADLVPGEQPAISENAPNLLRMKAVILDEPGCLPFRMRRDIGSCRKSRGCGNGPVGLAGQSRPGSTGRTVPCCALRAQ